MKQYTFVGIIVLICIGLVAIVVWSRSQPGDYDQFAQCLTEKGVKFYGAFWCPHCQEQKRLFGRSTSKLPYIECSMPDQKTQTKVCIDEKITGYPTWVFADGSRINQVMQLSELAEKSSCELPTTSS